MMPVFVKKIPLLHFPLDAGLTFRKKRLLGENKTVRGLLFAVLASLSVVLLQSFFSYGIIDYSLHSPFLVGLLIGIGVILGDALGSFIKRQFAIAPGESLYVLDQIDSVLVFPLLLSFVVWIGFRYYLLSIILWGVFHLILKYFGFILGIEEKKI